jgi:hypothetical protein
MRWQSRDARLASGGTISSRAHARYAVRIDGASRQPLRTQHPANDAAPSTAGKGVNQKIFRLSRWLDGPWSAVTHLGSAGCAG